MSQSTAVQGKGILELVNQTLKLPTIPTVLMKLNEVANDPDSSADDVAAVISLDPAIATNLLRIVNSAYYGLQVRVSSINLAVSIMGFNTTRKVALKAALFSVFGQNRTSVPGFSPEALWDHSVFAGVAAKVAAQKSTVFSGMHPEDLYICGLLHDLGKIILFENAQDDFLRALKVAADTQTSLAVAEKEIFGFQHSDVGSVLAIKWFLPEDLTIAVRYHHHPEKDPFNKSLSALIHLADWLTWQAGKPSVPGVDSPVLGEDTWTQTGIDPALLDELLEECKQVYATTSMADQS